MKANPLIQAPHVPKRVVPEWGQFIDPGAAGQPARGLRHSGKSSIWSQTDSSPYHGSNVQHPQQCSQTGYSAQPAWGQQPEQLWRDGQQQHLADAPMQLQQNSGQRAQHTGLFHGRLQGHLQHHQHHGTGEGLLRQVAAGTAAGGTGGQRALTSAHRALGGVQPNVGSAGDYSGAAVAAGAGPGWPPPQTGHHPAQHQPPDQQQHVQPQRQGPNHHPQQHNKVLQQTLQVPNSSHWQHAPARQNQQQQMAVAQPGSRKAMWDMDGDDDVLLPDSFSAWREQEPTSGSRTATAAPGTLAAHTAAAEPSCRSIRDGRMTQDPQSVLQADAGRPASAHHQAQRWQQDTTVTSGQQQQQVAPQHNTWQHQHQQHQQQQVEQCFEPQHTWQQPAQHNRQQQQLSHQPSVLGPGAFGTAEQQAVHKTQTVSASTQQPQQHPHWRQQQQQAVPPAQKRTAAASLWSGGGNLASLSRLPAAAGWAGGGSTAHRDSPDGQERPSSRLPAKQKPTSLAKAAAAAGKGLETVTGNGRQGSKAGSRGGKAGRGKVAAGSSSSGVTVEFVPRAAGEAAQQQLKLHQSTLFDTLKRAQRNKQREQQQQDDSSDQQDDGEDDRQSHQHGEGGTTAPGAAAADQQPNTCKRKRNSLAAAAAAGAGAGSGGAAGAAAAAAGAAASGGRGGASGSRAGRGGKASKALAALEGAVELLDTWHLSSSNAALPKQQQQQQQQGGRILDATLPGTAVWQQLQQEVSAAEGVALGGLYSRTVLLPSSQGAGSAAAAAAAAPLAVQFFTSLQPPYKHQQLLLNKAAAVAKKQAASLAPSAAAAAAADADTEAAQAAQDVSDTAGVEVLVGLAILPVTSTNMTSITQAAAGAATAAGRMAAAGHTYYIQLQSPAGQQQQQQQQTLLPPHVLQLLQAVLCDANKRPCVCCGAKQLMCSLAQQGLVLPAAGAAAVVDPELLGWLLDPQLIQDTKQEGCYTLEQQLSRLGLQARSSEGLEPLQRLQQQLQQCLQLSSLLHGQLASTGGVAQQAIKLEMQVSTILAKMEGCGVACAPAVLSDHRATLAARLAAIKARATQLVGRDFNLSSSSQLAKVLYEDLRLTPPAAGGGRGAAKTHLSTNEAALKQLAESHELPGLVLEHRCIMNVMSKWIDAPWVVQQATQQAGGRVHCTWQQTSTATGRLSSCSPNLQAVTKYTITAHGSTSTDQPPMADAAGLTSGAAGSPPGSSPLLTINVRDAFVAPPGKLLLSADYSQIELRLLAHFSEDQLLRQILCQSSGDVFNMIAAVLQQAGNRSVSVSAAPMTAEYPQEVSPQERERAKRVVYGIVYGLTPFGLAQQLADQGVSTAGAQSLIDGFLARFPGVRGFMSRSISAAQVGGAVSTLMGRRRPIAGLNGDFHERSAAERKVVNSQIQGSAADLIKLAMCAWDDWSGQQGHPAGPSPGHLGNLPQPPGADSPSNTAHAQLIAQIHDELLFEVDAPDDMLDADGAVQHPGQQFLQVAAAVKRIMEGAAPLAVPLRVKLAWGHSWGSLAECTL